MSFNLKLSRPLIIAGAIFLGSLIYSENANAIDLGLKNENPEFFTPLKQNEIKMQELDKDFEVKLDTVEEKEEVVEKTKEEVEQIAKTKEQLAQNVESAKNEVEQLKARLAEKKRLQEEERIRQEELAKQATVASTQTHASVTTRGIVSGNGYAAGYCTYYVKNRRPDIGNYWGNANQWIYSAQADGYMTGSTPAPGAIAVQGNHVAYVESVSGNMVTISEMNYMYLWNMNTRTVPASSFYYIY